MANIFLIAAAIVGGFALLRIVMGGKSSYSSRHSAAKAAGSQIRQIDAVETQINRLQNIARTARTTRQRELATKLAEKKLKQKERLQRGGEFSIKRA